MCADGSDLSTGALAAGLALLTPGTEVILVSVTDDPDPMMLSGTGHAGPLMSPEEFDSAHAAASAHTAEVLDAVKQALGLDCETRSLSGPAGATICNFASEMSARAIIMGTRGRGGFKRAVLGSVSDHVVRNAPCPVIVTNDQAGAE